MAQGAYFELERYPRAESCEEPAKQDEQKGAHGGLVEAACPPSYQRESIVKPLAKIVPNVREYSEYQ